MISYTCFFLSHQAFLAAISLIDKPSTFLLAFNDPRWQEAMCAEITTLEAIDIWTLKHILRGKRAVTFQMGTQN